MGRNDQNKVVVFSKEVGSLQPGDYASLRIVRSTGGTLIGEKVSGMEAIQNN